MVSFYWFHEASTSHKDCNTRHPIYTGCCQDGKISLPKFADWPCPLKDLLRFNGGPVCACFMHLIRHYNSMFCFTSLGAQIDHSVNTGVVHTYLK